MIGEAVCKDVRKMGARSWHEMHRGLTLGTWLRVAQFTSMLLGLYAIVFTYMSLSQVTHAKRLRDVERLLTIGLLDAESGQRAYLLTADTLFLVQYRAGLKAMELYEPVYKEALVDSQSAKLFREVSALIALKKGEMQLTIATHDAIGPRAAVAIVCNRLGHGYTEQIQERLHDIQQIEAQKVAPFPVWRSPKEFDLHDPNRVLSLSALPRHVDEGR